MSGGSKQLAWSARSEPALNVRDEKSTCQKIPEFKSGAPGQKFCSNFTHALRRGIQPLSAPSRSSGGTCNRVASIERTILVPAASLPPRNLCPGTRIAPASR